jgi:hypothetical protein
LVGIPTELKKLLGQKGNKPPSAVGILLPIEGTTMDRPRWVLGLMTQLCEVNDDHIMLMKVK